MRLSSDKISLRAEIRARRRAMSCADVSTASARITATVRTLEAWRDADTICAYLSLGNEVSTLDLVRETLGEKEILVPRSHDGGHMTWHYLHDWRTLAPGMYGILEPPASSTPVKLPAPEIVLVPGLAFDRSGHRLGHGGGYYDRFLAQVNGLKLALAYDWQLYPTIPHEPHDMRMDAIVSENSVIWC